jgi:hypothetical protein
MALLMFAVIPLVGGVLLARHNLRVGRGDVRGALTIGVATVVFYELYSLFSVNPGELGFFRVIWMLTMMAPFAHALLHGVFVVVGYLAIEPYVRRLWPSVLVSWARLVAGRVRDPIVGRDILIGTAVGVTAVLFDAAIQHLARRMGLTASPIILNAAGLGATIAPQAVMSLSTGWIAVSMTRVLTYFTLLVVLRFLLRNSRAAVLVLWLAFTVLFQDYSQKAVWLFLIELGAVMALFTFTTLRYGFVASFVASYFLFATGEMPFTNDLGAWFAPQVLFAWGIVAVVLVYGFTTAVGGRSLFRDPLSDPTFGATRKPIPRG